MSAPWDDPSGSEIDEFPDLDTLVDRARNGKKPSVAAKTETSTKPPSSVRRRKLGPLRDNVLLKPLAQPSNSALDDKTPPSASKTTTKSAVRATVSTRTRKQEPVVQVKAIDNPEQRDGSDASVEVAFDDQASADDSSDFHDTITIDLDTSDDSDDEPRSRYPIKSLSPAKNKVPQGSDRTLPQRKAPPKKVDQQATAGRSRKPQDKDGTSSRAPGAILQECDLVGAIDRLRIDDLQPPTASRATKSSRARPRTPPPSTPPKARPGLVSPKKLPRIPTTPHHPSTDLFWSREFVDDWNDEHSPKKQLFPDAAKSKLKQPASPKKNATGNKTAADREAKKTFEKAKTDMAQKFLEELDQAITQGRLSELAETTGGIKVNWSNKLNTTAGRANWKRETIRTKNPDGSEVSVKYRHHASIELAEKVIDDEHRLLNVVAHEFCHLANFMVNGITNNPHGKEFKAWAAKCSRTFGDRGIEVTTKHSYDIDFKYIWECTSCALEYKRHSKSINPERHRCGSCKSQLKQTRPVPRASAGKPSEYQKFMKEQMKLLKEENPKSPQKEIMKRVADRWSSLQASTKTGTKQVDREPNVDKLVADIEILDLDGANGE